MNDQQNRKNLAIASVIITTGVLISASLLLALGSPIKTSTTTEISTSTVTQTVTEESLCDLYSTTANATSGHATNCQDNLTLSLEIGSSSIRLGTNTTISLSIQNDLELPNQVNVTNFPLLPSGINPNKNSYSKDIFPNLPPCGLTPFQEYDPAFIMIYNSSDLPVTLTNPAITNLVYCIYGGPPTYHFTASQTLNETFSLGGYWSASKGSTSQSLTTYNYVQFNPGKYTMIEFDAFGDSVVLPFTVSAS